MSDLPVKPGYKTTEFWLSCLAFIISALYASDLIGEGTDKILGIIAGALVAMGYSVSRGIAKK